jgi:hypothetical protein
MPDEVESLHRLIQTYYGAFLGSHIKPFGELAARLQSRQSPLSPQDSLWLSVIRQDCAKTKELLSKGDLSGVRNADSGCTPLHLCCDPETARLLILHGFDPNAQDNHGRTPLHHACARKLAAATAKALLDGGAAPLIKDHFGRTPADCAIFVEASSKTKAMLLDILKAAEIISAKPIEPEPQEEHKTMHPPRL